ncbi:Glutathione transport system permease protein GsiD [Roseovarius sp. EC-HK134]|uniref:Glutathione transport system permease protein GsiD n=1 Tax=Roseovarius mucosus TaxID=215743 RepID=A0A1V0RUJ6_9RHOB|nr:MULTISPECIES: ABC transporter permease [Roseovarius]ARE85242.1 glutathione transport system permease protein GsiD [Roseovarius mucosus]VVT27323.1 Glutathione transport system permease protein GsiD [Roseovarius sp. EC-SD190]VVT27768.1 Glutathione transport system permease protein GsiD [Roseovarius sp. EC-HK134]
MIRLLEILRAMTHRPSGAIGLGIVVFHLCLAIISPWIVPFDYKEMNALQTLAGPSSEHWFGTDHLGRDVFSRVLLGGREALLVTGIATPIALLWGGLLGVYLGLRGGWEDEITLRLVDAFLALPGILPLLVLITVFGSGGEVLLPTLAFFFGIPVIRVARAAAHEVVARDFIAAARARGHRPIDIVRRELLPNVTDVLLVEGAMRWSWMLLGFSALSFLGFGVAPPRPDWGLMVSDARVYMSLAPWGVIAPVVALSSLIIGINLTADALAKTLGLDQSRAAVV